MTAYNGTAGNDTQIGTNDQDNDFVGFGIGLDTLTGGNRRDVFHLNYDLGAVDVVDGGAGQDAVDYGAAARGLEIHLGVGGAPGIVRYVVNTITVTVSGDPNNSFPVLTVHTITHELATLINIEDVIGTSYADTITGTFGDNVLDGGAGNDLLKGYSGNDTLLGGAGNDSLFGGTGANTLDGGSGNDTITLLLEHNPLAANRDTIEGGDGSDTLAFEETMFGAYGVAVTLATAAEDGLVSSLRYDATGFMNSQRSEASVTGIENVTGTDAGDAIKGNAGANVLNGMGGDDHLAGGGGQDTIYGGNGNDFIQSTGDGVTDYVNGGAGTDTISYQPTSNINSQNGPPVFVTLADGGAEGSATMIYTNGLELNLVVEDRLISIENVSGTNASDNITGNGAANELSGWRGQDTLNGAGGNDVLDGGAGRDVLTGGVNNDTFRFSHSGIGAEADRITDFLSGSDKIDFSPFYSQAFEFHNDSNNDTPPPEFIGSQAFSGDGNELRVFTNSAGQTVVQLDLDQRFDTDEELIFGTTDIEIIVTGAVGQNDFLF